MLRCKKLHPNAVLPSVAHPGEDLAYDLYALEDALLVPNTVTIVRTGIAAQARGGSRGWVGSWFDHFQPLGLLIRDRSSMAGKGIMVSGGVVDHGYTGEIKVMLTNTGSVLGGSYQVNAGDKIAQMIPILLLTGPVVEVEALEESARGEKGFGSSGR